jgi:hypothetical protein
MKVPCPLRGDSLMPVSGNATILSDLRDFRTRVLHRSTGCSIFLKRINNR